MSLRSVFTFLICACVCGPVTGASLSNQDGLTRFADFAKTDPIYAWPGVDLEDMEVAIEMLESSREEILGVSTNFYGEAEQSWIEQSLYPTEYLSEMVSLERARRHLISRVGTSSAQTYYAQQIKTISSRLVYLEELKENLSDFIETSEFGALGFHSGLSSFPYFVAGIDKYIWDAKESAYQAGLRWQCIDDDLAPCPDPERITIPFPEVAKDVHELFDTAPARITRAIKEGGASRGVVVGWATLNASACHKQYEPTPFLINRIPTSLGVPLLRTDAVSDVYVHDYGGAEGKNLFVETMADLGMDRLIFQGQTNIYGCPDAAQDTARLRSLVFARDTAMHFLDLEVSTADGPFGEALADASASATRLADSFALTESAADRFMHLLSKALSTSNSAELSAVLGAVQVDRFGEAILAYSLRTPFISQAYIDLTFQNAVILEHTQFYEWDYIPELLFTRNAPELLLGGSNRSIMPSGYTQMEDRRRGVSPMLLSYNEDLSASFTEAEITHMLKRGETAEIGLSHKQERSHSIPPKRE